MALSTEEQKLMDEIRKENESIAKARERVKEKKKQFDAINRRRHLEHKMGGMSEEDRKLLSETVKH
jgi:hypothetical protein